MNRALNELQSIQAMLVAGHRCVRLEAHSLLLIGGVGGFLAATSQIIISPERFPEVAQRALAMMGWLALWIGAMVLADLYLTRRARRQRDETVPFAQAQITRAWWMLLAIGVLGTCATFFYGGGGMIYGLWIVLLGLGTYLFGLFSRSLIEWIGMATILLGTLGLATHLPFVTSHWLAASCFSIGMPLAGWLNGRVGESSLMQRCIALLVWITAVVAPPLALSESPSRDLPAGPIVGTADIRPDQAEQILRLNAGAPVNLHIDLASPLLEASSDRDMTMRLVSPVQIAMRNGQPDGRFSIDNGIWQDFHAGALVMNIDRLTAQVVDGHPIVLAHLVVAPRRFPGGLQ